MAGKRALAITVVSLAACSSDNNPPAPPPVASASAKATATAAANDIWARLPVLAVWRKHGGHPLPGRPFPGPALRAALWEDGRMVFAEDRASWDSPLREGRVDAAQVKAILEKATSTGVFDLRGETYLVPDAPVLVTLVRVGERQRILYWDEVEAASYGINIDPKPHHTAFKQTWHALTRTLVEALPPRSTTLSIGFQPPPTWYLKDAIQSD